MVFRKQHIGSVDEMALGQVMKAVDAYLETVVRFGADPAEEGVASILLKWLTL